jgi:hypothetical protein
MFNVIYGNGHDVSAHEVAEFYDRLRHDIDAETQQIQHMMNNSICFVSARLDGKLVGIARGVFDGVRGYLTECKLDPAFQGPGAITRRDGRIEDDAHGIAAEMSRRVLEKLFTSGARRVDALAWGTEVDFCVEVGFKKQGGLVGLTMKAEDWTAAQFATSATAAAS